MMKPASILMIFLVLSFVITPFVGSALAATQVQAPMAQDDIVTLASKDSRFKTLVAAVKAADLVDTLSGTGPFTVFAPTDQAFAKLPKGTLDTLLKPENKDQLKTILLYHVTSGTLMAADVVGKSFIDMASGQPALIQVNGKQVKINNANITATDVKASNGVIHVIDAVILPPKDLVDTASADPRFKTLVAAVSAAGLVDTLKGKGPFTVFGPTDRAFAKLPKGTLDTLLKPENQSQLKDILLYHVVPGNLPAAEVVKKSLFTTASGGTVLVEVKGSKVTVNGINIVSTNILASNGIIHVLDAVVIPPKDIVDIASASPSLKTLVAAVKAAGLVDTLKGKGPFTVFAPTDQAFAKLPKGTLEFLLKPENKEQLTNILLYHVTSAELTAADVAKMNLIDTAMGQPVKVELKGNRVMINNAMVTITNIKASNGVIHVIDTVLLPPKDIVDTAVSDPRLKTLVAAVQAAGLVDALKGKGPFTVFAPTDQAFAKLPKGTLESLLKPENQAQLKDILMYHVIKDRVMSFDVVKLTSADTLLGKPLAIKVEKSKVMINGVTVIVTDILTSNGVIHIIDQVLLPPQ
jgi:transforming growth factor-beta-induced protein